MKKTWLKLSGAIAALGITTPALAAACCAAGAFCCGWLPCCP